MRPRTRGRRLRPILLAPHGHPDEAVHYSNALRTVTHGNRARDEVRLRVDARDRSRAAFATHTAPAPAATELGAEPTEIAFITEFVRGSMRDTEPSFWFATQTALPATAMAMGPDPTGMVAMTLPLSGSIRRMTSSR